MMITNPKTKLKRCACINGKRNLILTLGSWNQWSRLLILYINGKRYVYKVDGAVFDRFDKMCRNPEQWGKALAYLKRHSKLVHNLNEVRGGKDG